MALVRECEPGRAALACAQAELYEATNGRQGRDLRGKAAIVLTSVGARPASCARPLSCGSNKTASTQWWRRWVVRGISSAIAWIGTAMIRFETWRLLARWVFLGLAAPGSPTSP